MGREVGHDHVVAPERQALFGHDPFDVGVVVLGLDDVTGPGLAGQDVARREVVEVVVAVERADLAVRDRLAEGLDGVVPVVLVEVVGVAAGDLDHEGHRVAHLGEQRDAPLEVGSGQQLGEALDLSGLLGVVGDAGEAALPRDVVGQVGVPGLALQRLDEPVVDVGDLVRVEGLDPAQADHLGRHPVGEDHDVAPDGLARGQLVLDLGVELLVVVDVVGVVDGDPGLALEDLERGRGLLARVDVGRPVGDDQPLLRRRDVGGRHAAASCTAGSVPKNGSLRAARLSPAKATPPAPLSNVRRLGPPGAASTNEPSSVEISPAA
ncbi:MAG: hypothetical protein U0R80_11050 [Nocardioidaceae bacterium]